MRGGSVSCCTSRLGCHPARRRRAAAGTEPLGVVAGPRRAPVPRGLRPDAIHGIAAPARAVRPLRTENCRRPADAVVPGPRLRRKRCSGAARSTNRRVEFYRPRARSRGRSCIEQAAAASSGAVTVAHGVDGGMVLVECRFGDAAAVEMMVDSGAQHSVISAPLARRLGLMNRLDGAEQSVAAGVDRARIIGKLRSVAIYLKNVEFALDFSVLEVPDHQLLLELGPAPPLQVHHRSGAERPGLRRRRRRPGAVPRTGRTSGATSSERRSTAAGRYAGVLAPLFLFTRGGGGKNNNI